MVYIITPLWKLANVELLESVIPDECHWIIVVDKAKSHEKIKLKSNNHTILYPEGVPANDIGGYRNRDWVLDNFDFNDEDWIRHLDDDSPIHKDWFDNIKPYLDHDLGMIVWRTQTFHPVYIKSHSPSGLYGCWEYFYNRGKDDGMIGGFSPACIDACSHMAKWKYVKDVRFVMNEYPLSYHLYVTDKPYDYHARDACYSNVQHEKVGKGKTIFIDKYLGWWNVLRCYDPNCTAHEYCELFMENQYHLNIEDDKGVREVYWSMTPNNQYKKIIDKPYRRK